MDELIAELKLKIIAVLNLIDVKPDDIKPQDQLIGGELGLDSIDVLELVMMLEEDYGIIIDTKELGIQVFTSLETLADYVYQNQQGKND
jgi:acyl carrier protein